MRQKSTLVALFFLITGVIAAFVLHLAAQSAFAALRITDTALIGDRVTLSVVLGVVLGLGGAFVAFSMAKTKTVIGEVMDELNKVNWPAADETRMNTLVVVVTSVVAAVILGFFDFIFLQASTWLASQQIQL